jgi:hypothetical protein
MKKMRFPLLALVVFVGLTSVNWSPEEAGIDLADPAALKEHGTTLTPVLDEAMARGKNVLWCATFQMAWDAASQRFGRPLLLQPACQLADSLNQSAFDRRWVDEGSIFTVEGRVDEGVLSQIDAGVRAKTGRRSKLRERIKQASKPGDLVFFAMLHKDLGFVKPFGKLGNWELGGHKVPWFGFTPEQQETGPLRNQVRVHHYGAQNDFVIELLTKETGDQLMLAKLPTPPATPGAVSKRVLKRMQANAPEASPNDLLAVPNVVADETARFSQLEGRKVAGKDLVLRQALQSIEFRMDEKGVKLHSEASISFACSASAQVQPRLMVLDPPFALVMKRKNAPQPYFVAWFANADLLGGK